MQQLENRGKNLWLHEDTMPIIGTKLRLRMSIIKLTDGRLWVHSPTALSAELQAEVDQLGPVAFIIGPSNGHNLWLTEWQSAYPNAAMYVSAGITKKLSLQNPQLLDESTKNIWHTDLEHVYLSGATFFNESVFLHKATKSLLVTDIIQNHSDQKPAGIPGLVTRFIIEPLGFKGRCIAPPLKMRFIIKDKQAFKSALKKVSAWDFKRIIVTHGDVIEPDAKQIFSSLCARFLN
jgi:hypothetical protein